MAKYDLIAATGCATGIAHTYMAQEALEQAAKKMGLTIKVETHGQTGVDDPLTQGEIDGAKALSLLLILTLTRIVLPASRWLMCRLQPVFANRIN